MGQRQIRFRWVTNRLEIPQGRGIPKVRIAEDRVLAVMYQFNEMLLSRRRLQISTKVRTDSQKRIINLHLRSAKPTPPTGQAMVGLRHVYARL